MQLPSDEELEPERMADEIRDALEQAGRERNDIEVGEKEERTYTIRGNEQAVLIQHGKTDNGRKVVVVLAPFLGRDDKPAMLMLLSPEDEWDESELESIIASMD